MNLPKKQIKVIIIDDEPAHRLLIEKTVERAYPEAELLCGQTISDGKTFLTGSKIDLLIVDLRLAHESGIELLIFAKNELTKPPKVVVVTTSELERDKNNALSNGADNFLTKSEGFTQHLQDVVTRLLNN
jgi:CheY-like chemotaxis protein